MLWFYSSPVLSVGMADDDITTVQVEIGTWKELGQRKEHPGETYDDVIQRLLRETEGQSE